MKTLQMYINDPNYSIALESTKAYAGGISVSDIRSNINNPNNLVVDVDISIPKDGVAITSTNTFKDVFEKNNNSIRKASLDAAKTVLFVLSQLVHERSGAELEIWGHTWFENYMKTLQMYINDPNYSIDLENAKAYAGGISVSDIRNNINNPDNLAVDVDISIPKDGVAITSTNTFKDVFDVDSPYYSTDPFAL